MRKKCYDVTKQRRFDCGQGVLFLLYGSILSGKIAYIFAPGREAVRVSRRDDRAERREVLYE